MLFRLTGDARWAECADLLSRAFSGSVKANPSGFTSFLTGAAMAVSPGREIVVVGEPESEATREMLAILNRTYAPHQTVLCKSRDACRPAGTGGWFHRGARHGGGEDDSLCLHRGRLQPAGDGSPSPEKRDGDAAPLIRLHMPNRSA